MTSDRISKQTIKYQHGVRRYFRMTPEKMERSCFTVPEKMPTRFININRDVS
jgi:hypothetical protein